MQLDILAGRQVKRRSGCVSFCQLCEEPPLLGGQPAAGDLYALQPQALLNLPVETDELLLVRVLGDALAGKELLVLDDVGH